MTVVPLDRLPVPAPDPDVPIGAMPAASTAPANAADGDAFARAVSGALDAASASLERADAAERAFVAHRGGLSEMTLERARADVMLSLAGAATSHIVASLTTILGMQV